ncbi:MAG: glycosyltransferase [Alphaproteobacteria bacterium]|nr:glycosyltransferase [Alphaproteobacteria bacterium]
MSVEDKKFPLFSIITITLNHRDGFVRTQESVDAQTFKDYEWVVIDGGSTDGTVDLLRGLRSARRTDPFPFYFISEPDDGIYDAMNKGIKQARGRYLIFMNAGDVFASGDVLEKIAPKTEKKPDFIAGASLEPEKGQSKPTYKAPKRYKDMIWGMITHHQAMFYNRLLIRDRKLHYSLRYKVASDYDFTLRFLMRAKKIVYSDVPICLFEQGGISQRQAYLGRKEQFIIRNELELVKIPKNLLIFCVQSLSWQLRQFSPALYNFLKSLFVS